MPRKPPSADKPLLEALRDAIAEGDTNLATGCFRIYKAGDLVREMRDATLWAPSEITYILCGQGRNS
jgi:hypothetical protein